MQNQVLVVVLKDALSAAEILEVQKAVGRVEGVVIVKTFERVVEDALPVPAEKDD